MQPGLARAACFLRPSFLDRGSKTRHGVPRPNEFAPSSAMAGHLLRALVRPTLEVIITENPVHLRKRQDDESGLALIRPDA